MRRPRFVIAGFSPQGLTLYLCLLGSGPVHSNPVLADEQSLDNGARLYELYCSECHGRAHSDRAAELDHTSAAQPPVDYSESTAIAPGKKLPEATPVPAEDKWPEWADRPDPNELDEPDVRAEFLSSVTAMIDKASAIKPQTDRSETEHSFDSSPGVTDLSEPQSFFYGTSEEELFNSIAKGTGAAMPGWETELGSEEDMWDLVNYIRSFWGEEWLY